MLAFDAATSTILRYYIEIVNLFEYKIYLRTAFFLAFRQSVALVVHGWRPNIPRSTTDQHLFPKLGLQMTIFFQYTLLSSNIVNRTISLEFCYVFIHQSHYPCYHLHIAKPWFLYVRTPAPPLK
jgi:hypothetical protein